MSHFPASRRPRRIAPSECKAGPLKLLNPDARTGAPTKGALLGRVETPERDSERQDVVGCWIARSGRS